MLLAIVVALIVGLVAVDLKDLPKLDRNVRKLG